CAQRQRATQHQYEHRRRHDAPARLNVERGQLDFGVMALCLQAVKAVDGGRDTGGGLSVLLAEDQNLCHQAIGQGDANAAVAVVKLPACGLYRFALGAHELQLCLVSSLENVQLLRREARRLEPLRLIELQQLFGQALVGFQEFGLLGGYIRHDIAGERLRQQLVFRCQQRAVVAALFRAAQVLDTARQIQHRGQNQRAQQAENQNGGDETLFEGQVLEHEYASGKVPGPELAGLGSDYCGAMLQADEADVVAVLTRCRHWPPLECVRCGGAAS